MDGGERTEDWTDDEEEGERRLREIWDDEVERKRRRRVSALRRGRGIGGCRMWASGVTRREMMMI